jgi:hypothetical protein
VFVFANERGSKALIDKCLKVLKEKIRLYNAKLDLIVLQASDCNTVEGTEEVSGEILELNFTWQFSKPTVSDRPHVRLREDSLKLW